MMGTIESNFKWVVGIVEIDSVAVDSERSGYQCGIVYIREIHRILQ